TIVFAFSNPYYGTNKVGVGVDGMSVWKNMSNHKYEHFTETFTVKGIKLKAVCSCTGGDLNNVKIILNKDNEDRR
ncbi:MAG: hypothetical protein LPH19_12065, partial [Shewanella sp.]|nr:hypothetical protein [Shewanella sp.]